MVESKEIEQLLAAATNGKPKEENKKATESTQVDMKQVAEVHKATFNLPKLELHAHIGGCFRPTTFLELAMAKNVDLDAVDFYNVNINTAFEFFKVGS